jgi:hypothetical protein
VLNFQLKSVHFIRKFTLEPFGREALSYASRPTTGYNKQPDK